MLLLYYTSTVLLSLGFRTYDNGFDQGTDIYDRKYLPQYICIADCVQHLEQQHQQQVQEQLYNKRNSYSTSHLLNSNLKPFNACVRICKQRNAFTRFDNSTYIRRKQENLHLNLICRDDTALHFRITFEKISEANVTHRKEDIKVNKTYQIFVIKISKYSNSGEYRIYVCDEMSFTFNKLLPQTTYNITTLAVQSNGDYSVIAKQQLFNTLRKGYKPNNIKDIKLLRFFTNNQGNLSATIRWKPGSELTCYYDIICFSPGRQNSDLEPLHIRNPQLLYTYNLHNLIFSTLYKVGIRAKSTKSSWESDLYWKTFHTPTCVDWHQYNFNICAPLELENLNVKQIYIKHHEFALNISWNLPDYLPENYTLWIKDRGQKVETILGKYQLSKNATSAFIPNITLISKTYEINLTAFSRGGQTSFIYNDFITTVANETDESCVTTTLSIIILTLFCIIIISAILMYIYHCNMKFKRKQQCKYMKVQKSVTTDICLELKHMTSKNHNNELKLDYNSSRVLQVFNLGTFGLIKQHTFKDNRAALLLAFGKNYKLFHQKLTTVNALEKYVNIMYIQLQKGIPLLIKYYYYDSLLNYLRYHNKNDNEEVNGQLQLRKPTEFNDLEKCKVMYEAFECDQYSWIPKVNTKTNNISTYSPSELYKLRHYQVVNSEKLNKISASPHGGPINETCTVNRLMPSSIKYKQVKAVNMMYLTKQVAMGKEFLAQNNIDLRYLAESNILITFYGIVKIGNFK